MTGDLFDPRPRNPIARDGDPDTSHEAAAKITSDGTRDRQANGVLAEVNSRPGSTSAELGGGTIDRYVMARRLPELEKLGLVSRGESRMCGKTGRRALTWWPRGVTNP